MLVSYEQVVKQVDQMPFAERLRLVTHVLTRMSVELPAISPQLAGKRGLSDAYGIWKGVIFDEEDFKAAEWHPTEEEMNGGD